MDQEKPRLMEGLQDEAHAGKKDRGDLLGSSNTGQREVSRETKGMQPVALGIR